MLTDFVDFIDQEYTQDELVGQNYCGPLPKEVVERAIKTQKILDRIAKSAILHDRIQRFDETGENV